MKIRQTIKKAVALGTGALMLGATILGASAANVSDYPSAFIKDGKVNAKIVVGEKAQVIDVVGAIDIAADLQSKAVSKETVTTSGTGVAVTGGKTKEIALGAAVTSFGSLGNSKIPVLKDEKISWNDKDIDVVETLDVSGMTVFRSNQAKQFGAEPRLGNIAAKPMTYRYTISDSDMDITKVGPEDSTHDGNLKLDILGKAVEISDIGNNTVTMSVASEYYLTVGDSVTVNGKKVTLKNVGNSNNVVVDVDGVIKTVGTTSTTVNGLKVEASSTFYVDDVTQRSATLKVGDKITQTISNGDSMELFGEPSSKLDANWVWNITSNTGTKTELVLGADFNQFLNTNTEPVRKMGEKLNLPNDYASIYMDSLTAVAADEITFEFKSGLKVAKNETGGDIASGTLNNVNALVITGPRSDTFSFSVDSITTESNVVYLMKNGNGVMGGFENTDGDIQLFTDSNGEYKAITVTDDQTVLNIQYTNNSAAANVTLTGNLATVPAYINLDANISAKYFGLDDTGYTASDYSTNLSSVNKGYDYLTDWGVVIKDVEAQLDSETFAIVLPPEQVKVNVVVVGSTGSASSTAGSVTTDKVNPIGVDFGVLDKDAPAAGSMNLIVVGGPCVNTVAARLAGNPAVCTTGFAEGEAKLAMFDDNGKVALLVAGYAGRDTQGATRALINEVLPSTSSAALTTINYQQPKFK